MPTKTIEQYMVTETVYRDDFGIEIERVPNDDYSWYDTQLVTYLTDEELENELS